jgi:hypothetical protein
MKNQDGNKYYAGNPGIYVINKTTEQSKIMGIAQQVKDRLSLGYGTEYTYSVDDTGEFVSELPGTDITAFIIWAVEEHGEITVDTFNI